jgi:hypothetical protein
MKKPVVAMPLGSAKWNSFGLVVEMDCPLEAEVARLRQVCRDAYEVWAGSEGIPVPETCAEAYLLQLLEQMRDEVKKGL